MTTWNFFNKTYSFKCFTMCDPYWPPVTIPVFWKYLQAASGSPPLHLKQSLPQHRQTLTKTTLNYEQDFKLTQNHMTCRSTWASLQLKCERSVCHLTRYRFCPTSLPQLQKPETMRMLLTFVKSDLRKIQNLPNRIHMNLDLEALG